MPGSGGKKISSIGRSIPIEMREQIKSGRRKKEFAFKMDKAVTKTIKKKEKNLELVNRIHTIECIRERRRVWGDDYVNGVCVCKNKEEVNEKN